MTWTQVYDPAGSALLSVLPAARRSKRRHAGIAAPALCGASDPCPVDG